MTKEKEASYKTILSLDGGGIRGMIAARILRELESRAGRRNHALFDLTVGTSTGGIFPGGLPQPSNGQAGRPCTPEELANVYSNRGREVFSRSLWKGVTNLAFLEPNAPLTPRTCRTSYDPRKTPNTIA